MQVRLYLQSAMRRTVDEEVRKGPDVVHVHFSRMAPYMPEATTAHRHLDLMDSLSVNMATRARSSSAVVGLPFAAEARLLRRYEARAAAAADTYSVISAADRDAPGLEGAAVIQNGVDIEAFPFHDTADRDPVMTFFGNLGYFHNIAPAVFVATEVLPLVASASRPRPCGSWEGDPQPRCGSLAAWTASRWPATCPTWQPSSSGRPSRSCPCSRVGAQEQGAGGLLGRVAGGDQRPRHAGRRRNGARAEYLAAEGARDIADAAALLLEDPGERGAWRARDGPSSRPDTRGSARSRRCSPFTGGARPGRAAPRQMALMTLSVLYTSKVTSVRM